MRTRALFALFVLAAAPGCLDEAILPSFDFSPDASRAKPSDAGPAVDGKIKIDAGLAPRIDASAGISLDSSLGDGTVGNGNGGDSSLGTDAGDDPCPPVIPLRSPAITEQRVERELAAPRGGSLTSGTYFLTKSELVINPASREVAKQDCREKSLRTGQNTLLVAAESDTQGTLVSRARHPNDEDATHVIDDFSSTNRYTIEGSAIIIRPAGVACETRITTLGDGGIEQQHEIQVPDTEDDPTTFTATPDSLTLISLWEGDGNVPTCWYVDTYSK